MNDNMEQRLKDNLKTFIMVCSLYFLAILLVTLDVEFITKINEVKLGDIVTLILPVSFSSVFSFTCYFLIDFDIHNKIDKIFLRRKKTEKQYSKIIITEAKKLNYIISDLSKKDSNFIFYYIANRQPELRELAFNYWCKIYTFDLYIATSVSFFVFSIGTLVIVDGFNWLLLAPFVYLIFAIICWLFCIPKVYNKAVLLPERQVKDFAISNEQEFCNLIVKMGFEKSI